MISDEIRQRIQKVKEQRLTELNLSNDPLASFDDLSNSLKASPNLTEIPTEVFELEWLEKLDLSWNKLTSVPEALSRLTNLSELDLSHHQLTSVPEAITRLTNLSKLNLSSYFFDQSEGLLTSIPEAIARLTNLSTLDLSGNQLTSVPEAITRLTNLSTLDLSGNQLTSVPETITRLTNLSELDLRNNQLTSVPEAIARLTNLSKLNLGYNQLTSVPEAIARLPNLSTLDLSDNQLTSLPEAIARLTNLSVLNLSDNQLTSVPEAIARLTNLSVLNLSDNQLTSVPEAIARLTNLSTLNLSDNQLTSVPEAIARLTNLSTLYLSRNQLTSVPEAIARLTNLSTLYLSRNQLTSVPEAIARLTNLSELDLGGNQLISVPEAIARLTNLSKLYLVGNQLTSVPEAIARLTNLSKLYLVGNQLTSVPEAIVRLPKLSYLNLSNNPLEDPPFEIANKGIEAIREYFRQKQAGEDTLYEAKLIIIGEGGAGKTTLARKIQNPNSPLPKPDESTQGVDVQQWHFPLENGSDFRVNIWDFGGQEIYHATHQFFLTKRSLYLLVADSRKEHPHLDYWLNVVELFSDSSPLIIIKNEINDRPVQIDETQLRGRFENFKASFATNLGTQRGTEEVENIIKSIKYHISQLPYIGNKFPKTWTKIRHILEQDNRNYITLDEYFQICDNNGITVSRENPVDGRLTLSQFLHDLGVILHFQDDKKSLLYKTIILQPNWGTDAVYKVLDSNTVKRNLGQFTDRDLSQIWQDSQYNDMQGELLELMMKFKLCYPLNNRKGVYIAPQLLNSNPPEYQWNPSDNLFLRYEYDFMPKGILTRFIVEMHHYIEEPKVWRSGVILKRDHTFAEVIETYDRREMRIRLSGTNKRGFLEVITDKLDEIHRSYERLKVKKMIPCNCSACKDSQQPHFYDFEKLRQRMANNKQNIECDKPPYNEVNVLSLIDDTIGRDKFIQKEREGESNISYHIHNSKVQINQGLGVMEENQNKPIKVKSAWANGSFYLFVFVVVVAGIGFLGNQLAFPAFCVVVIGGILFVPIIGALQLKQDERLQDETFLELMKMAIGQLPLIGNILTKVLNPSDNSEDE